MRKTLNLLALAALISMGFWSCKSFPGATVNCSPDPIEVHADSIKFQIRASVPPKSGMKKGGTYLGRAKIGGSEVGRVLFSADKYPNVKKTGIDTTITFRAAFREGMDGNSLMVEQDYERKGKSFELPPIEDLCECCITTSRLVYDNWQYQWSKHEYQREVKIDHEAKFNFPKDVWKIQEGQYDKADIQKIGDLLKSGMNAKYVEIEGFASPEGPYKRNVMLSVNRSKQVQEWLIAQLEEYGYKDYLDTNFFKISVTHEDWENFKEGIQSQPYSQDVKNQIIEIISAGLSPEEQEKQIMALVGGKDKVEHILAPLRRATIRVVGTENRRSDMEIDKIAQDFVDGNFSGSLKETYEKEEWLYAISRHEDLEGKKSLLEAYRDAYPADFRAFNDLGVIYLKQNDVAGGLNLLDKAKKLKDSDPAVANNLGVAYAIKGKYDQAKSQFEASLSAMSSPEANFNLGVVLEKMARYLMAAEAFNKAGDIEGAQYNAGLSKLLMGDLQGARSSLEESTRRMGDESAWPYYVLAVAGARAGDATVMSTNLRKAVSIDPKLKAKARTDLEFRKYWTNAEFKAAVN